MQTALIYAAAALAEIIGCFAFWGWLTLERPWWWALGGVVSLVVFAWLLTLVDVPAAGRAFAAYGGVYIVVALLWMAVVERVSLDRWDLARAALCITGAALMIGPLRA
jgi:small multidrug resistance family-3 protein